MERADILIKNASVMTMDDDFAIIAPGAIAIQGKTIASVGKSEDVCARYTAHKVIDASGKVVMPGLIDTYSHAGHGMIKAIYHDQRGWPGGKIYFHATSPQWWYAESRLSALERVRFGVTCGVTVIGGTPARTDDPAFGIRNADGVIDIGLRGMVGVGPPDLFVENQGPTESTWWEGDTPEKRTFTYADTIENTLAVIRQHHRPDEGMMQVFFAMPYLFGRYPRSAMSRGRKNEPAPIYTEDHIPVLLDKAEEARSIADGHGVLIHTHMFKSTIDNAVRNMGRQKVLEIMGPDVVIAHGNGLLSSEIAIVSQSDAKVVSAPSMGENVWYGRCPVPELIKAGVTVAVATDGNGPRVSMDLLSQVFRSLFLNRLDIGDNDIYLPGKALSMITKDAARVIGMEDRIGSLESGKLADVIIIDLDKPHLIPSAHLPQIIAFYANGNDVDTTIVNGRILMEDRVVKCVDEDEVKAEAREEIAKSLERVGGIREYLDIPGNYWTG